MVYDQLIIGQGLCGTLLSRRLIKAGQRVLVVDNGNTAASSRVAGGLINPVTGKRMVRTWLIEELLPIALQEYKNMEQELNIPIISSLNILDFHTGSEAREIFAAKQTTEDHYLHHTPNEDLWQEWFTYHYGIGTIYPAAHIKIGDMMNSWRNSLSNNGQLMETDFDLAECEITEQNITYKGLSAHKIIFCDGAASANNPFFDRLPWSKDKGEVLIVSIPGLPATNIYKKGGISIVPWKDDLFWVGASHDWKYTTPLPTATFSAETIEKLKEWLKISFEILDHKSALRPANFDRKPFVGFHPLQQNVGIFNGMGGKGFSVAPMFARQLADHITLGTPIMPDVDVRRYSKILSR
jgi:glycine/D-amino acid oxidase-like deaminating enzyme